LPSINARWRKSNESENPWRMARLASIRRKTLRAPARATIWRQYGFEVSQSIFGREKKTMMRISMEKKRQLRRAQATHSIQRSCQSPMKRKISHIESVCVDLPPSGI